MGFQKPETYSFDPSYYSGYIHTMTHRPCKGWVIQYQARLYQCFLDPRLLGGDIEVERLPKVSATNAPLVHSNKGILAGTKLRIQNNHVKILVFCCGSFAISKFRMTIFLRCPEVHLTLLAAT